MDAKLIEHKDLLRSLYIAQNKSLKTVMNVMETQHQVKSQVSSPITVAQPIHWEHAESLMFRSQSIYVRLFGDWNFRKNTKGQVWDYVDHRIAKRETQGKRSNVYINGALQPPEKIRKEIARHVTTLQQLARATAPSPCTPEGWAVLTPQAFNISEASTPSTPTQTPVPPSLILATDGAEGAFEQLALDPDIEFVPMSEDTEGNLEQLAIELDTDEMADAQILVEVMQKCGAFISLWGREERSLARPQLLALYHDVGQSVSFAARISQDLSEVEPTAYTLGVTILANTLRNESDLMGSIPEGFDHTIISDVMRTALFVAARKGCGNAAASLLSAGVKADSRDSEGVMCLLVAAESNHPEVVDLLLTNGAQVDSKRRDGHTAWTRICGSSSHEAVAHILTNHHAQKNIHLRDNYNVLYQASCGGHAQEVSTMLRRGMNPSFPTVFGWCPLHYAAASGHFEVVTLLIEAGADVNSVSDQLKTPLDMVKNKIDRAEIKTYLLAHGAMTSKEKRSSHSTRRRSVEITNEVWSLNMLSRGRNSTLSPSLSQRSSVIMDGMQSPYRSLSQQHQLQQNAPSSNLELIPQTPRVSPIFQNLQSPATQNSSLHFQLLESNLLMSPTVGLAPSFLSFSPFGGNTNSYYERIGTAYEPLNDEGYGSPAHHVETPRSLSMPSPQW